MEKKFELNAPTMPNFVYIKLPPGKKEEGLQFNSIPITDLTESEAIEYGELMKQTFIEHWKQYKKTK